MRQLWITLMTAAVVATAGGEAMAQGPPPGGPPPQRIAAALGLTDQQKAVWDAAFSTMRATAEPLHAQAQAIKAEIDGLFTQRWTRRPRARSRLHRSGGAATTWSSEVVRAGRSVALSGMEFKLLAYFIEHRGALLTRNELLDKVWGYDALPQSRTVDVHVGALRQKLERVPAHPELIVTVHRQGYRFTG